MTPRLSVLNGGLSTTVQDSGRPGYQRFGVPTSGALDPAALCAANLLVGNDPNVAALEIAYTGPTIEVEADSVRLAFAGGEARIQIYPHRDASNSQNVNNLESVRVTRGQVVQVGSVSGASVVYLAIEGGFNLAPVLGSLSTFVRGGIGGLDGRPLKAGDKLPLKANSACERDELRLKPPLFLHQTTFRIIAGPQVDYFAGDALDRLCDAEYKIAPESDRTGLRLEGPRIPHLQGYDIASDVTAHGSIQIPGTQTPIVLLVDRQTTGGYPKIANVISADLPALGRAPIGSIIRFERVNSDEAVAARRVHVARLAEMESFLETIPVDYKTLSLRLLTENIVDGFVDACD